MKKLAVATLATSGLAVVTLGLAAPATAAPSGAGSAQDTVNQLQSEGRRVILNKVGSQPLDQCTVSSVRAGDEITRLNPSGDDVTQDVVYTTVYVTADC